MDTADIDKDGKISLEDFRNMINENNQSSDFDVKQDMWHKMTFLFLYTLVLVPTMNHCDLCFSIMICCFFTYTSHMDTHTLYVHYFTNHRQSWLFGQFKPPRLSVNNAAGFSSQSEQRCFTLPWRTITFSILISFCNFRSRPSALAGVILSLASMPICGVDL